MALPIRDPFHEQFYHLLEFINKTITETTTHGTSLVELKKETSHILRRILFEIQRQSSLIHSHLLSEEQKNLLRETVKAIILNIHTKYNTKPASDLFEKPTLMEWCAQIVSVKLHSYFWFSESSKYFYSIIITTNSQLPSKLSQSHFKNQVQQSSKCQYHKLHFLWELHVALFEK